MACRSSVRGGCGRQAVGGLRGANGARGGTAGTAREVTTLCARCRLAPRSECRCSPCSPHSSALGAAQAAERTGTDCADRLVGTSGADTIRGRGGNDRIDGRGGGDLLHGGGGRDTIVGQEGPTASRPRRTARRDTIACGIGLDVVNAEHHDAVADDCEVVTRQLSRGSVHRRRSARDAGGAGQRLVRLHDRGRVPVGPHLSRRRGGDRRATSVDAGRTWRQGFLQRVRRSRQRPGRRLRPTRTAPG